MWASASAKRASARSSRCTGSLLSDGDDHSSRYSSTTSSPLAGRRSAGLTRRVTWLFGAGRAWSACPPPARRPRRVSWLRVVVSGGTRVEHDVRRVAGFLEPGSPRVRGCLSVRPCGGGADPYPRRGMSSPTAPVSTSDHAHNMKVQEAGVAVTAKVRIAPIAIKVRPVAIFICHPSDGDSRSSGRAPACSCASAGVHHDLRYRSAPLPVAGRREPGWPGSGVSNPPSAH